MTLLVLGGTSDARRMTQRLYEIGVKVRYSIVGLVRQPDLACEVISGGFSQYGGLTRYIEENKVTAILDASHPYARKISDTAVDAAKRCAIPCIRFLRPEWEQRSGDQWMLCGDWDEVLRNLRGYRRPFFTVGQLTPEIVAALESGRQALVRSAVDHKTPLSGNCRWIKAIGPFSLEDEIRTMQDHRIDVLVSKNAGGNATIAKLDAARELRIPVLMLDRPSLKLVELEFTETDPCVMYCTELSL